MISQDRFWAGRKVFVTGHTGFKGSWLCIWLHALGARVYGYALGPPTSPSLFVQAAVDKLLSESHQRDIRDISSLSEALRAAKPEVVFHLAAQPLVKDSYSYPIETYSTNVMGTVNLLEAVRSTASVRAVVNITTDKVYENREWVWGYRETDALGGFDPYSNSKACSELVTSAYRDSFFNEKNYQNHQVAIATARSGNVIGGGDWAANRLLPDCISAFQSNKKVILRYPNSVRPWQHVLDTLNGYLMLARKLFEEGSQFGGGWNFSPDPADGKTVSWIVDAAARLWGQNSGYIAVPTESAHETGLLMLDSSKSRYALGWKPRWHIEYALSHTVGWFKSFHAGENAYQLCRSQIALFEDSI